MRYRLRLNGTQDADLIALYRIGYPLGTAFADAACVILAGADRHIPPVPSFPDDFELDLSEVRISITIPETSQEGLETTERLSHAEKGFRAMVFRSCLRNCLPEPCIGIFTGTAHLPVNRPLKEEQENRTDEPVSDGMPEGPASFIVHDRPDGSEGVWGPGMEGYSQEPGPGENRPHSGKNVPGNTSKEETVQTPDNGTNIHKSLFGGFVEEY